MQREKMRAGEKSGSEMRLLRRVMAAAVVFAAGVFGVWAAGAMGAEWSGEGAVEVLRRPYTGLLRMTGEAGVAEKQEGAKRVAFETAVAASRGEGLEDTVWAIEQAGVGTRILHITAHPDDESGAALAYLARGLGADVALLSVTRGEGGQNALGPEQGAQLAALRSRELLEATRIYGTRLFFTRAEDRGYTKTVEETKKLWEGVALRDMVAVIRKFRPHIVINNWAGARTGHGHHQTAGLLTPEAARMAGISGAFTELQDGGLESWELAEVMGLARGGAAGQAVRLDVGAVSPVFGRTYAEMGSAGFSKHRTQGVVAFTVTPFAARAIAVVPGGKQKLTAEDFALPMENYVERVPGDAETMPKAMRLLAAGRAAALRLDWAGAVSELSAAGQSVAELVTLYTMDGEIAVEDSREWRQAQDLLGMSARVDRALALAAGARLEAMAEKSEAVAGESFRVRVQAGCRTEVKCTLGEVELVTPEGWEVKKEEGSGPGARFVVSVPRGAVRPVGTWDWMLPEAPPLVKARVRVTFENGYGMTVEAEVVSQRATSTRVDTLPLELAPAVTLAVEPKSFVVLREEGKAVERTLEMVVRVRYRGTKAAEILAGLAVPEGWTASEAVQVSCEEAGDRLVKFTVTPGAGVANGTVAFKAYAEMGGERYETSLEPLATLPEKLWREAAEVKVHVFEAKVPAGLRVGYVAAENDPVPEALGGIGVAVEMLDEKALAFGELGKYDAIVVGIRAYELRGDLIRSNARLLKYVEDGGRMVVQYQRNEDWNRWKPGPWAATAGREREGQQGPFRVETLRTTDENSPVRFVEAGSRLLNSPNKITATDFEGWVQERGLYYWGKWDERYRPVLGMRDAGEEEMQGALVYGEYGKGMYVYTGLAFFRQLPAGVPGAWRLFVNLVAGGKGSEQ